MKNKYGKILLILLMCITVITGCTNETPNSSGSNVSEGTNTGTGANNTEIYLPSELEKNIVTSGAITKRGKLVVFVTNNNPVAVDMEIEVEFYDANGTIVGSDEEDLNAVGANAEIAAEMWSTPDNWSTYKIYVDVEHTDEISYFDKVSMSHSNNGKEIAVQVTNNSEELIDYITVAVVYYQGDTVVGIDYSSESDIKSNRSANFTLDFPYDNNYDDVNFNTYKVFVTEAYSYDW